MEEKQEENALVVQARTVATIADEDSYHMVVTMRALLKDMIKELKDDAAEGIENAKATVKALQDNLAGKTDPMETEYNRLGALMSDWAKLQERIQLERQAAADAEAKAARQADADLASQMGDKGLAKKILSQPVEPAYVPSAVPKVAGLHYQDTWHYAVQDENGDKEKGFRQLVNAVAGGKIPIQALHDTTKPFRSRHIQKMVTDLKASLKWPGVQVWSTKDPRQRQ